MLLNKNKTTSLNNVFSKLVGNVKILIDSNNKIYLQSINSNDFLKNNSFKCFKIEPKLSYGNVLNKYSNQLYGLNKNIFFDSLNDNLFSEGFKVSSEQMFNENFCYTAPIFIYNKETIPDYFIIFKIPENLYETISKEDILNYPIFLKYDIKNKEIGEFLQSNDYPKRVYQKDLTKSKRYFLNGINFLNGNTSKSLIFYDDSNKTQEQISTDLILKFKENNIISSNYFLLEFLFNDSKNLNNKNIYKGFYFYKNEISELKLDIEKHNHFFQYKILENNYNEIDREKFNINNELGVDLYLSEDINYIPNSLYELHLNVLNDKNNNFYSIRNYENKTLKLTNKEINFADIFGIKPQSNFIIPGKILNSLDYANLVLTCEKVKNQRQLFYNGDYISIVSGVVDYYEWRIIANENMCCYTDWCYYQPPIIKDSSDQVTLINEDDSNIIMVSFDRIYHFDETDTILLSCGGVYGINQREIKIEKIEYDIDNEKTILTFVDKNGDIFNFLYNIGVVEIIWIKKPYWYTHFNPLGDDDYVASKISKAFNVFPNKTFDVFRQNNKVVFKSKFRGIDFSKYKFVYNFSKSNTLLDNFKINDKKLQGTNIYSKWETKLFSRNRGIINFTGEMIDNGKLRFSVEKEWSNNNITGNELIETKKGKYPLVPKFIEQNKIWYSNYLENFNNKDNIFENLDDYHIYSVYSNKDEIIPSAFQKIMASYIFYPELIKLDLIDLQNI